eukprot:334020_1
MSASLPALDIRGSLGESSDALDPFSENHINRKMSPTQTDSWRLLMEPSPDYPTRKYPHRAYTERLWLSRSLSSPLAYPEEPKQSRILSLSDRSANRSYFSTLSAAMSVLRGAKADLAGARRSADSLTWGGTGSASSIPKAEGSLT